MSPLLPCKLGSYPFLPVPYRALLDLSGSFVSFFFCGIVGCWSSRDYLCCFYPLCFHWSRALSWASVIFMQASSGVWWFLYNRNVTPVDVVHGFVYSFWFFIRRVFQPHTGSFTFTTIALSRLKGQSTFYLLLFEPLSRSPFYHIYCIFTGDLWSISYLDVRRRQLSYKEHKYDEQLLQTRRRNRQLSHEPINGSPRYLQSPRWP